MHRISLIVATKDRPGDLRKLMESLREQTTPPAEIIIVDAGRESSKAALDGFPELAIRYLRYGPPSAAAQRNVGILACGPASTLIAFADDDTTFEPQAFSRMLHFWNGAAPDLLGAAFNLCNYPERGPSRLKHSRFAERIGLYSSMPGTVARSGWQTVGGKIAATQFVEWLPSTAVLFRREIFLDGGFDEAFESYSYLEDLDLSYGLSRLGRLAVVADAGFYHHPSAAGRVSARQFGRYEVRNRLYFVRKHGLSLSRCYLGLIVRLAMSVGSGLAQQDAGLFRRALGNVQELLRQGAFLPRRVVARPSLT